jgi:hypothetical protein
MIDYTEITKHLHKDNPCFDHLQYEASYKSGWNKFLLKGCKEMEVWYNESNNLLKVKGSLPYYWQKHNFTFDREALHESIQDISARLKINLWEAELSRFEYGSIIEVQAKPEELIRHHIKIKGMQTRSINPDVKIFEGIIQSLKLYDAGRNMKNKLDKAIRSHLSQACGYDQGKQYLKIENHYKKPYQALNSGIRILVNDLLIPEFYQKCKTDLLSQYRNIMKTETFLIPKDKKALSAGNIILLAFKETESLFNINAEERIKSLLKAIPEEILNQNDKKARKLQIRKMLKEISDPGGGIQAGSEHDLYSILEAKLMMEN